MLQGNTKEIRHFHFFLRYLSANLNDVITFKNSRKR